MRVDFRCCMALLLINIWLNVAYLLLILNNWNLSTAMGVKKCILIVDLIYIRRGQRPTSHLQTRCASSSFPLPHKSRSQIFALANLHKNLRTHCAYEEKKKKETDVDTLMVLTRSPLIPSEYKGMHLAIHSCGTGGLPVGTKFQPPL